MIYKNPSMVFILKTLDSTVCLEPSSLGNDTHASIRERLTTQYTDRIVDGVGLVICLYDVLHIGEGSVYHSCGQVYYKVSFRAVVFCPFQTELIVGTVRQMTEHGLHVSLGFFDDIFVPPELLQQPAIWNNKEWCWKMDEESDPLYYSLGGKIRLKVHTVSFVSSNVDSSESVPRFSVIGRADSTGLGMVAWEWSDE